MDSRWEKQLREDSYRRQSENPSFSSTLLDAIYRSIDEPNARDEKSSIAHELGGCRGGAASKKERTLVAQKSMERETSGYHRISAGRQSSAENASRKYYAFVSSSSTSSDSSSACGFSTSETDSVFGNSSKSSSAYGIHASRPDRRCSEKKLFSSQKSKQEGNSVKSKSKTLKVYADGKKVKQPLSPGSRLASFLNSLFTARNGKTKALLSSSSGFDLRRNDEILDLSVSSYSRSCLNKTPSARGKVGVDIDDIKKSLRLHPATLVVDEESKRCVHRNASGKSQDSKSNEKIEGARVAVAREFLRNAQIKFPKEECMAMNDEDDDDASCASSDLFELENLSCTGMGHPYREELPVYETTHLGTNLAIANGLLM